MSEITICGTNITLKEVEWDAREQELADSAAKSDPARKHTNRISAEAKAVEWVNPNLGAITRSGRTVKSNGEMPLKGI